MEGPLIPHRDTPKADGSETKDASIEGRSAPPSTEIPALSPDAQRVILLLDESVKVRTSAMMDTIITAPTPLSLTDIDVAINTQVSDAITPVRSYYLIDANSSTGFANYKLITTRNIKKIVQYGVSIFCTNHQESRGMFEVVVDWSSFVSSSDVMVERFHTLWVSPSSSLRKFATAAVRLCIARVGNAPLAPYVNTEVIEEVENLVSSSEISIVLDDGYTFLNSSQHNRNNISIDWKSSLEFHMVPPLSSRAGMHGILPKIHIALQLKEKVAVVVYPRPVSSFPNVHDIQVSSSSSSSPSLSDLRKALSDKFSINPARQLLYLEARDGAATTTVGEMNGVFSEPADPNRVSFTSVMQARIQSDDSTPLHSLGMLEKNMAGSISPVLLIRAAADDGDGDYVLPSLDLLVKLPHGVQIPIRASCLTNIWFFRMLVRLQTPEFDNPLKSISFYCDGMKLAKEFWTLAHYGIRQNAVIRVLVEN